MHLKSLTLRGFKSFASTTTLRFEPGVTCVVGPNGSGKSNVVDAIAWVLGEQGAKSLRGGKMEDVVFAGTSSRPPLGRAEVVLTIDNTDGALPIEYTEVTISRLMYRSGESEYSINGTRCRLLDITELLSDSGIGRELHVIVGQGQLDAVLHAAPEDRRAYIEEAAGILKHRRRKEKALRKLAATDQNLERLGDLLSEIRRQLKPLGRQAEAARRAVTVSAQVRDARARLMADDIVGARSVLEQAEAKRTVGGSRLEQLRADYESLQTEIELIEGCRHDDVAAAARLSETEHRLERLSERCRGLIRLARERAAPPVPTTVAPHRSTDPESLERESAAVLAQAQGLAAAVEAHQRSLRERVSGREVAEAAAAAAERAYLAAVRARSDTRESLARLEEQTAAAVARCTRATGDVESATTALKSAQLGEQAAREGHEQLFGAAGGLSDAESDLDGRYEHADSELTRARAEHAELVRQRETIERDRTQSQTRSEALEMGMRSKDGAGALLAAGGSDRDGPPGVLGLVGASVSVAGGYEAALSAALGAAADAVAVAGVDAAVDALAWLREQAVGRAGIVVARSGVPGSEGLRAGPAPVVAPGAAALVPAGAQRLSDLVSGPEPVASAVRLMVADVVVTDSLQQARTLVDQRPELRAVTSEGDLVGSVWAAGGTGKASVVEVHAAHAEACRTVVAAERRLEETDGRIAVLAAELGQAELRRDEALSALHESDASIAAAEQRLGRRRAELDAASHECQRAQRALDQAQQEENAAQVALEELRGNRDAAHRASAVDVAEPSPAEKEQTSQAASQARTEETQARLELRAAEENHRVTLDRGNRMESAARTQRQARAEAEQARERRERAATAAVSLGRLAQEVLGSLEVSTSEAAQARAAAASRAAQGETEAVERKDLAGRTRSELDALTEVLHREEVSVAEQRVRVSDLVRRATDELRMEPDDLVREYGPDQMVPSVQDPDAAPTRFDRTEQEELLARAEKALARLGDINPLAMEEFAALEERHAFLVGQMEDVQTTRRELTTVVREIDERIRVVFAEAFADVAEQFTEVFAALFPGGEGRLLLTDPDDPLKAGVEVEARPPGKKVKRLSLLSGGERSLTAIALLVAIFRARPSPFYVLDEVEAALDDTNLARLVGLLTRLRDSSQLIVITHQKRMMEAGDALYGVSMRSDGISEVISQRLRAPEQAVSDSDPNVATGPAAGGAVRRS